MICVFCGSSVEFKVWQVSEGESGTKLLQFLQNKLGNDYSLRRLKRALESNLCLVNGRVEHFGSMLVGRGDRVEFSADVEISKTCGTKFQSPAALFEDQDFLAIDKPPGISSEDPALIASLEQPGKRPSLALAHRLDKETSGVLVLTKSIRGKEALYRLFKERKVHKSYLAVVDGVPKKSSGRIENYLGKISSYQGQSLWGSVAKDKGVIAITEWRLVQKGALCALVNCFPLTGRTHQIRIHLAGIGHPILGDKQYGKHLVSSYRPNRCLLHAAAIAFEHPFTGQKLCIESTLPDDFKEYQPR